MEYHRVEALEEALALLARYGDDGKVLAGGQSLVPMMSAGFLDPEALIDINHLSGLGSVRREDDVLHVGALARHRSFEVAGDADQGRVRVLAPAARLVGHQAVRNRGTLVGSVVHADPSGEWPAVALALDGRVRLARSGGERCVAIGDFLVGPMTCAIEPDELALEVLLPLPPPRTGGAVKELTYRHGDYAIVGIVAQLSLDQAGTVTDARIALFGVEGTPVRATEAEKLVVEAGRAGFEEAGHLAQRAANPGSDATASAAYRSAMIPHFCLLALREAYADALR